MEAQACAGWDLQRSMNRPSFSMARRKIVASTSPCTTHCSAVRACVVFSTRSWRKFSVRMLELKAESMSRSFSARVMPVRRPSPSIRIYCQSRRPVTASSWPSRRSSMRAPTCGRPSGDKVTPSSEGGGGLEGKQPWSWSRTHYIWGWISNCICI